MGLGCGLAYRTLALTRLGPPILKRTLTGDLPARLTLDDLYRAAEHLDWRLQEAALGLREAAH